MPFVWKLPAPCGRSLLKPCVQWGRYSHLRAQNCPFFNPFFRKKRNTEKMAEMKHTKMEDSKYPSFLIYLDHMP